MPKKSGTKISSKTDVKTPAIAPNTPRPESERNKLFRALANHFIVQALNQNNPPKPADSARLAKAAADLQSLAGVSDYLITNPLAEEVEQQLVQALFDAATGIRPDVSVIAAKFLLTNLFSDRWSHLPQPGVNKPHSAEPTDAPANLPPFRIHIA